MRNELGVKEMRLRWGLKDVKFEDEKKRFYHKYELSKKITSRTGLELDNEEEMWRRARGI